MAQFIISLNTYSAPITTFQLTSATSGTLPFTVGLGFKKGDIPNVPKLNIVTSQVIVKRRWNDGSVKHAIASGQVALTSGVPLTVNVDSSLIPSGVNLVAANIATANPSASVKLGTIGTVNLSSLLATPFRTWIIGPEMVEAHYRSAVGSDATLAVWFYVRLYKGGKIWIRTVIENGYLDKTTANKNYIPTIIIGGTTVYNNAGASLTHYAHTRWTAEGWVGGDPQVTPRHDTQYLKFAKLVPNYMINTPSAIVLNGLYQNYAPNQNGDWTVNMGETGYQAQLGLMPLWDAMFITSLGDPRAYKAVLANAKAINNYAIEWNESGTNLPTKPSNKPNWSLDGADQGGSTNSGAGNLSWENSHHGSGGYLAYIITGDYFYLETMENQVATAYLMAGAVDWTTDPSSPNLGTSRYYNGQTRGYAWCMRTLTQYVGIAPAGDDIAADYSLLLANNMQHLKKVKNAVNPAGIGYLYEYDANLYGPGTVAPWQQHFFIQSIGMGSDLEPLADMTIYNEVRDYMYSAVVGILGTSSGFCFTQASTYTLKTSDGKSGAPSGWFKTWDAVYKATFTPAPACTNILEGSSGSDPTAAATGFWGNLMPAIAYAVDHKATGATAAWARLTGASNWPAVLNSGFNEVPNWGIVPRNLDGTIQGIIKKGNVKKFKVFANPENTLFNFSLNSDYIGEVDISVTSICGQTLKEIQLNKSSTRLESSFNLSNQPAGIYFLRVNSKEGQTVHQIVRR